MPLEVVKVEGPVVRRGPHVKLVRAEVGHALGGGRLALAGVVVNSSLVMVDYINRQRIQGMPVIDAVTRAGICHSDLELEITEGQIIEHLADVDRTLRKLTAKTIIEDAIAEVAVPVLTAT